MSTAIDRRPAQEWVVIDTRKVRHGECYEDDSGRVLYWHPERESLGEHPILARADAKLEIVLALDHTPESRQIVEHPELFWITSMDGTSFSRSQFRVSVREAA